MFPPFFFLHQTVPRVAVNDIKMPRFKHEAKRAILVAVYFDRRFIRPRRLESVASLQFFLAVTNNSRFSFSLVSFLFCGVNVQSVYGGINKRTRQNRRVEKERRHVRARPAFIRNPFTRSCSAFH